MENPQLRSPEPIAIVGIGCNLPGNVRSPADLWKAVMAKDIASSARVPASRFDVGAYLHPHAERPGSFAVPGGYFLDGNPQDFDPGLFRMSPVEAMWLDPQQRKLLEVAYEAVESSGTTLETLASGRRTTGCFAGTFTFDFQHLTAKEPDFRHPYAATGGDTGMLASRISYVFDLKGPSLTVNTACSSSLYALDLACKAIASGECDGAVVCGVNLILHVDQHMNTAKLGVLSPTNQCHSFDEAADGYGRAEGVGALYIKTLSAAMEDGDPIRAVIRSTATGSSGRCPDGMTHPSQDGQVAVMSLAYKSGNLKPEDTAYIECHGTGTPVGDPIEVAAVQRAMGATRDSASPILIGSIKPNFGHSEAGSSMATLVKATLALESGIIPPTAGINNLNKSIPWDKYNVKVVTDATPFPSSKPCRRIGVSASGYGGANSHAILESVDSVAPGYRRHASMFDAPRSYLDQEGPIRPHLLLFSAHDAPTLKSNLITYASRCQDVDLTNLAYTLGVRRTKFPNRTFAICHEDAVETNIGAAVADIVSAPAAPAVPAFVFTGQGAQWPRMGGLLLQTYPSVLQTIRRLDRHLSALHAYPPSWTIEGTLSDAKETADIHQPEYSQPLCTAVQIALVDLLARWGVRPVATVGHSSGEIGAAYAAGRITAEGAITAAYFRGKVAGSLRSDGAMLAVGLGAESASKYIKQAGVQERVVVACHNSPNSATLSGDHDAIAKLKDVFDAEMVFARVLRTNGRAYHSHHMQEAAAPYLAYLKDEPASCPGSLRKVPMYSTVTGTKMVDFTCAVPEAYWVENLKSPVLFRQGVQSMLSEQPEINSLIEVGPHPALIGSLQQICQSVDKANMAFLPTLKRKAHDIEQMLALAGNLWAKDASIDIEAVTSVETLAKDGTTVETWTGTLLVDLPPYQWTYQKSYWAEPRLSKEQRSLKEPRHDILGRRVIGASPLKPIWRNVLCRKDLPWLAQHRPGGEVMLPGAGYLALAIEAITQISATRGEEMEIQSYTIRDVFISNATVVPDDDAGTETLFHLQPVDSKPEAPGQEKTSRWYQFSASCCAFGTWKETATGKIAVNLNVDTRKKPRALASTTVHRDYAEWLVKLRSIGIDLGPPFHHISSVYTDGRTPIARGDMDVGRECGLMEAESRYVLHPTVLDACIQLCLVATHQGRLEEVRCGTIPTHFGEVTVYPPSTDQLASTCLIQAWTPEIGNRAYVSNCQLVSPDGTLMVDMARCRGILYSSALPPEMRGHLRRDLYTKLEWKFDADYLPRLKDTKDAASLSLASVADILLHKDPALRILCVDGSLVPSMLVARPSLKMTVATASREVRGALTSEYLESEEVRFIESDTMSSDSSEAKNLYNFIISPGITTHDSDLKQRIIEKLAPNGRLLTINEGQPTEEYELAVKSAGFTKVKQLSPSIYILKPTVLSDIAVNGVHPLKGDRVLLIHLDEPTSLQSEVSERLISEGWNVSQQPLVSAQLAGGEQVILLADIDTPFLMQLKEEQLNSLVNLTENAASITWVTRGGLVTGDRPEFGMTLGAARAIRKEKGTLDLVTVDFDSVAASGVSLIDLLADITQRQHDRGKNGETEYCIKDGAIHIGRLVSHVDLNRQFVSDSGETLMFHQHDHPALEGKYMDGKVVFEQAIEKVAEPLAPDAVEVHVAAVGLTASDGADDAEFLSHEMAGTITRVGAEVGHLKPGTEVIGFAFDRLGTFQRTSASLVHPLPRGLSLKEAVTLPSASFTSIYGLENLARVETGEHVVIVDDLGAAGFVAIQLCRNLKANAIVIASSTATAELIHRNGLLAGESIISRHDQDLSAKLDLATAGKGVDVLLCSTTTDEMAVAECRQMLAPFARVVAIGSSSNKKLELSGLSSNSKASSFFHFDPVDVIRLRPHVTAKILKRCMELYSTGQIQPILPVTTKRPMQVNEVIQSIPSDMGSGKYVISYDENVTFKAFPSRTPLKFKSDVTYLMIGCLGGLGRQVALWMAQKGAKHMVFVSRSGEDSPAAAATVKILRDRDVNVSVLRADITRREELASAFAQINPAIPIKGVLNAAGIFNDKVFSNMTIDAWRDAVDAKVKGCLNLHDVLKDEKLDFFVMTGSIASMLGSAGQSNYSAANALLDSLACHRRCRGLPAVSLILPAIFGIGHISERAQLKHMVESKGTYGIEEKEMLEAFEVAMTPQRDLPAEVDHICVGVQPQAFGKAVAKAGIHAPWKEDPRLNWIGLAADQQSSDGVSGAEVGRAASESLMTAIQQAANKGDAVKAATGGLVRRLARVLMIDEESVEPARDTVSSLGLDSMIGAEFRNWIFREVKINVPFQQLLAGSFTIVNLAEMLYENISGAET
ncbi:putative polyketide synthase [Hypoxylon sp. FL1284]|nr:putative polyketide synthase [Hypoxylon sp. FL1284]